MVMELISWTPCCYNYYTYMHEYITYACTSIMTAFGILSLSSAWCLHSREVEPRLYGTVSSLVPPRSRLALKGPALHEYSSFLSQISRSESSRLQENNSRTKQRGRYVDTEIMLAKLLVVMNLLR